jgi:hypothetical protein
VSHSREVGSPDAPSRLVRALLCYSDFDEAVGEEVKHIEAVPPLR